MSVSGLFLALFLTHTAAFGPSIELPPPATAGGLSVEECIAQRRSVREFARTALSADQISRLLWSAQGITGPGRSLRAAPSAGALYPLETRVVLAEGVYHYDPVNHRLTRVATDDRRAALQKAALDQEALSSAPAVFVFSAVYSRTTVRYRDRAHQYVHIEAGHACQNMLLQATSIGLAGVPIGAFEDRRVAVTLGLKDDEVPLYLVPVGYPAQ